MGFKRVFERLTGVDSKREGFYKLERLMPEEAEGKSPVLVTPEYVDPDRPDERFFYVGMPDGDSFIVSKCLRTRKKLEECSLTEIARWPENEPDTGKEVVRLLCQFEEDMRVMGSKVLRQSPRSWLAFANEHGMNLTADGKLVALDTQEGLSSAMRVDIRHVAQAQAQTRKINSWESFYEVVVDKVMGDVYGSGVYSAAFPVFIEGMQSVYKGAVDSLREDSYFLYNSSTFQVLWDKKRLGESEKRTAEYFCRLVDLVFMMRNGNRLARSMFDTGKDVATVAGMLEHLGQEVRSKAAALGFQAQADDIAALMVQADDDMPKERFFKVILETGRIPAPPPPAAAQPESGLAKDFNRTAAEIVAGKKGAGRKRSGPKDGTEDTGPR